MAKDSFKVKKSLNIKPTDPATLSNSEVGDIVIDSTDNNKLKTYNDSSSSFVSVSSVGSLDTLLAEDFETTLAADFISGNAASPDTVPTGSFGGTLADETSNQLSGVRSLKYTMNATSASSDNDFFLNDTDIALAVKQRGNFIGINFYYTYNGDDDDIRFFVLDQDDNELTQSDEYIKAASTATRFSTSVFVPSSDTAIRYGFQVVTGNSSKVFIVDDIEFSTNPFVYKNLSEISSVQGEGNGSTVITGGVTNIDFTEVSDSDGAWNGTAYTIQKGNSIVSINGSVQFTSSTARALFLYKNGTSYKRIINDSGNSGEVSNFSYLSSRGEFDVDDAITIRTGGTGGTLANNSDRHYINIIEYSEAEHVVTPAKAVTEEFFVNNCAGRCSSGETYGLYFNSAGIRKNTISQFGTVTEGTSSTGAKFTATKKCVVTAYMTFENTTSTSGIGFMINGDLTTSILSNPVADIRSFMRMSDPGRSHTDSVTIELEPGDVLAPHLETLIAPETGNDYAVSLGFSVRPSEAQFLAAVPVPQIAYVNNTVASGGAGQSFTINGVTNVTLNEVKGDQFVSLSSSQFTIPAGKYDIEAFANVYCENSDFWGNIYLYDETNAQDTEIIGGGQYIGPQNNYNSSIWKCSGPLILTAPTTFSLRAYTNDATGTANGHFGYGVGTAQSMTHVQVKITKIK